MAYRTNKTAVQFGAGNIGRGFIGQLLYESGYRTTFVDVDEDLIRGLNERGEYPLRIVDERVENLTISAISALHARDTGAIAQALAEADLAATAVGVSVLPKVAPAIARGLERRFARPAAPPLNIIVCENMLDAGPFLREEVRRRLDPRFTAALDEKTGFVEASIGRMVPVMTAAVRAEDPLLICVEAYSELPVDARGFKGPIPELKNLQPHENFGAYVERKLFIHNAGHAAAAYLGHLRGHEYIWQAISDPVVRLEADAALEESQAALASKHGLDSDELRVHTQDLIRRFHNRALGDQVSRVARDPIRKLGPKDRLVGAAQLCFSQGITPEHLAFVIAAALHYNNPNDPSALNLRNELSNKGLYSVFEKICGITPDHPLCQLIETQISRLVREGWILPEDAFHSE